MSRLFRNPTFRHVFAAQITALVGTGLMTVALALLAFDLAGERAGLVLGALLTAKMAAYVTIAPIAGALADSVPRKHLLVTLDLVRAGAALALPFATQTWHVFALVLVLQSASAAFVPTFQATLPDILTDEDDYTRALSLSRIAAELEQILSPALAAVILLAFAFDALFLGTLAGFLLSAALLLSATLPARDRIAERPFRKRVTRGLGIFLATPRLRGLLALNLAVASAGAMVLVNTVVLVRAELGLGDSAVALALGAFGMGSIITAALLPRLLRRSGDRAAMLAGAVIMACALTVLALSHAATGPVYGTLLACWGGVGLGYAAVLTPTGRLLRRSAHPEERPPVFAAQFALSHLCWFVTYPLAGVLMTQFGTVATLLCLALLTLTGTGLAAKLWPRGAVDDPVHDHPDLPSDHPHIAGKGPHRHEVRIDALHPRWPTPGHRS